MSDFSGKVCLITGGASGIGCELARALAEQGAHLVLADVDEPKLRHVCAELIAAGRQAWYVHVDVRSPEQVEQMAQWAFAEAGRVDALVNCAGIRSFQGCLEMTVEQWDRVVQTNLRGPFLVTQAVVRRMIDAKIQGQVLSVGSVAGELAIPGIAHYGAAAAGLGQLTRVLAVEMACHGIRVNAVLPGVIKQEPGREHHGLGLRGEQAVLDHIPLRRPGEIDEVVGCALFLLSDDASYCTGGLFSIDGGLTLGIPARG